MERPENLRYFEHEMSQGDSIMPFELDLNASDSHHSFNNNNKSNGLSSNSSSAPQGNLQQNTSIDPSNQPDIKHPIIGAGPLRHNFGMQTTPGTGSTLTEFTKRRNWSQRVIEELKDFLYILSPDGRFIYASPSVKQLTGYEVDDVVGKLISDFIHPDDANVFVREFNESIASGNSLRFFYRFKKKDDQHIIFESHGHPHLASEAASFGPNSGASFCRGFFMMARPYPTKNAAMIDSFLEHKIENERLKKRIADLRREEQEDLEGQQHLLLKHQASQSLTPSMPEVPLLQRNTTNDKIQVKDYNGMPPPAKPTISNTALTRQNLDEALASSRPDSINDKMARYEGSNHLETIEMLTGLRYRDGERSKGISTGATSPKLIHGDAGIAIMVDKEGRRQTDRGHVGSPFTEALSADKKKKLKVSDEYVCTDCGTLDSPEWRKGPSGPKTLCNACGLRWAKKEKKRSGGGATSQPDNNTNGDGALMPAQQSQQLHTSCGDQSMQDIQMHGQPNQSRRPGP